MLDLLLYTVYSICEENKVILSLFMFVPNTPPLPAQSILSDPLPNRLAKCPVFASRLSGHKLKYRT